MEDSPGRLLSSLSGREGQLPPQMDSSCVGVLMQHLFQWDSRLQGRKYFLPDLFIPGCRNPSKKQRLHSEKFPMAKFLLIANENCSGESFDSAIAESNLSTEDAGSKRTPGVVARLMGLESLPSMEQVKDSSCIQLQSVDNDDETHEFAKPSTGYSPKDSAELCLQRTSMEEPLVAGDVNGRGVRKKLLHLSENVSELSTSPALFSSWDTILSSPNVSPSRDYQKLLLSKSTQTKLLNKQNCVDLRKGRQQQFYGKELCSACLNSTGGNGVSGLENLDYKSERRELNSNPLYGTLVKVMVSTSPSSKTSTSTENGSEDENVGEHKMGLELKQGKQPSEKLQYLRAHSAATLPLATQIGNVDAITATCTKSFSSKKLELRESRTCQDSCRKERGSKPQQSSCFQSIPAAGSPDMEVIMKAALSYRRNKHSQAQYRANSPATSPKDLVKYTELTEILQKEPFWLDCATDSSNQIKMANRCDPRASNLAWERHSSIKVKQQVWLPAMSLQTAERKKASFDRNSPLEENSTKFQSKERLCRSKDMTLRTSKKSSEPMIRSCKRLHSAAISEHPIVKNNQPKRIANRRMMMSKGNIYKHYLPPKDADKGDIPKKYVMQTDKYLETNCLSGCQSPKFARNLENIEYHPWREIPACNITPEFCSASLELQVPQKSDDVRTSKQFKQLASDVKGTETPYACMCLTGGVARCYCIHGNHTLEDFVLESVMHESTIKEAQISETSLLKTVLKGNSQRLPKLTKESVDNNLIGSLVKNGQSKQTLQHILESHAGNRVAVNTSTTAESRIPVQVCSSTAYSTKKRIEGKSRQELDGDAENHHKITVTSEACSYSEIHNACWWEDAGGSCLPWNSFGGTPVDDYFGSPPCKSRPQRMSLEQADVCETMSDSTCTEDSEQPSPVSVIDAYSPKKIHPKLQKGYQHLYEYHMKVLQYSSGPPSPKLQSENCNEICKENVSKDQHIPRLRSAAGSHRLAENEQANDHCELGHPMAASGFELVSGSWNIPYSQGFLITADLFENMEEHQCLNRAIKYFESNLPEDAIYSLRLHKRSKSLRTHHQLLFDCFSEALNLSLRQSMLRPEQVHSNPEIGSGEHMTDVLWKCISGWKKLSMETVDRVADAEVSETDAEWRHFWQEVAEITRITEEMVLEDVLQELFKDLIFLQK